MDPSARKKKTTQVTVRRFPNVGHKFNITNFKVPLNVKWFHFFRVNNVHLLPPESYLIKTYKGEATPFEKVEKLVKDFKNHDHIMVWLHVKTPFQLTEDPHIWIQNPLKRKLQTTNPVGVKVPLKAMGDGESVGTSGMTPSSSGVQLQPKALAKEDSKDDDDGSLSLPSSSEEEEQTQVQACRLNRESDNHFGSEDSFDDILTGEGAVELDEIALSDSDDISTSTIPLGELLEDYDNKQAEAQVKELTVDQVKGNLLEFMDDMSPEEFWLLKTEVRVGLSGANKGGNSWQDRAPMLAQWLSKCFQ